MKLSEIMDDPFYSEMAFYIESMILRTDAAARKKRVVLKDSHIKSSLSKVKILARGKTLRSQPANEREKWIVELAYALNQLCGELRKGFDLDEEGEPISLTDWLRGLKLVEESLDMRTQPGTRNYIEYLEGFMARMDSLRPKTAWWKRPSHVVRNLAQKLRRKS